MTTLKTKLLDKKSELLAIKADAYGNYTREQASKAEQIAAEIVELERTAVKADQAAAVVAQIKGTAMEELPLGQYDPDADEPSHGTKAAPTGSHWAKTVRHNLTAAAHVSGVKSLLSGQVQTPAVVEVAPLPIKPRRLLDLIPRVELATNTYGFLRQTVATNNAAVVADNALKPTSVYTLTEVEGRARVVAHLSEPFPLRYLEDYEQLGAILDSQMVAGVLETLEAEILAGDGTGEHFTGLLHTSGVTQVPFKNDMLTTVRSALTTMLTKNEAPTAWVLNPLDVETMELLRENGATGGFLMDSSAYDTVFGAGAEIARLVSTAVPQGTALLADWNQTRLRIRQGAHTLAATQSGDLFDKNQVKLRAEGRFAFDV